MIFNGRAEGLPRRILPGTVRCASRKSAAPPDKFGTPRNMYLRVNQEFSLDRTAHPERSDVPGAERTERSQVEDNMEPVSIAFKKTLAYSLSCVLVSATIPEGGAWSQNAQPEIPSNSSTSPDQHSSSSYTGQGSPLTTQEIDSLVSPIALYPDALVAQILSAATFPDQIAVANYWIQQNKSLTGSALMQAADKQSWDPSVKALTQFPTVLNNMAQNLSWTSQLGDAYHNQASEVMAAVQTLRKQAQTAGNLKSTPQQTVTTKTQSGTQVIVIQP